ncbi:cilia- and flagella-associated protein 65 isoform X2 [Gouania willdenowi]|uniref:cilia- and flagella-associated protein 65 isoform X2 n=1 Tax=Gouania willdenowi TaxID=441366 RepID=UPI001055A19D|nr:cilia- and flagella-associated protein 65-like isoform X2 [Gouania willdenowi]
MYGNKETIRFAGLEACPELVWDNWETMKDLTKNVVVKNIGNDLKKLLVRPPRSSYFSVLTSTKLIISPGMSVSIPVTFKPCKMCDYGDTLDICGRDGKFHVKLFASLSYHNLEVPSSVTLPLCAVQHSSHASFILKNLSIRQTFFQWKSVTPFQLSPEQGLLKPYEECLISVTFLPQEALAYQRQSICWFGDNAERANKRRYVLLQGLANDPYLQLRNLGNQAQISSLHVGSVALGQPSQESFEIFNPSLVTASFSLVRLFDEPRLFGFEFTCDVTKGEVEPGGSQRVTVTYSPSSVDSNSVEFFTLQTKGGLNHPQIRLTGHSTGPKVWASPSVVDFGCVQEGESAVRTLELVNCSAAVAVYQWDLDCTGNSVFRMQSAGESVLPHSSITLQVVYGPSQPGAHHRRVACLLLHGEPVFVDLLGTCHSELQQPVILKPEHLMVSRGPGNPEGAGNASQQSSRGKSEEQDVSFPVEKVHREVDRTPMMSTMEEFFQSSHGCMDAASLSSSSTLQHVSVVPNELVFDHKGKPTSTCVCITNHSSLKLSLVWTVSKDSPFSLNPSSDELAPLKSTSFKVTYNPKQLNTLHGAQLECFAYPQNAVTGKQQVCLPWCVTVRVIGHSFQPQQKHFLPVCSLKPPTVVFPPMSATSYMTVLLQNDDAGLPLTFCLDHNSNPALAESVSVVPSCGFIEPAGRQILTIRSTPTEDSPVEGSDLTLELNAAAFTKELRVVSVVEKPRVSLESGSTLCFQPTDVGAQTERTLHIRNHSCLPTRFKWIIPEPEQRFFSVETDAGELAANDILVQTWCFTPEEEKSYALEAMLSFWHSHSDGSISSNLALTVTGSGAQGYIQAVKSHLDLRDVLLGSHCSFEVPLVNSSPCLVSFCFTIEQKIMDDSLILDVEPIILQLESEQGTLPSHSTMQLLASVLLLRPAQYIWTISYQKVNANGMVSSPAQTVCEVRAQGVFPTLQVIAAYATGALEQLAKTRLWKIFSLHRLNEQLMSYPTITDLRTVSTHSWPPSFIKTLLDLNFSSSPVDSAASSVRLMFYNPQSVPVDWAFLLPEDQQRESEYWAETGQFSSEELSQVKLQENKLFSVVPRSGTLLPGQKRAVEFSYCHDVVGTHLFPVVFTLSSGRKVLLNFHGTTSEADEPVLQFDSQRHVFTPGLIGDQCPQLQTYDLHNGGRVPVFYSVDTAVLSQLQIDNFNHPVLICLNPEGQVCPGTTTTLEWIFSPLEAKMYQVDVPIHIRGGATTWVRFEGCGTTTLGSRQCGGPDPVQRVPMVPFPGQGLLLSEDSVFLEDIPVSSTLSRIVFLTNVSSMDSLTFTWILPQQQQDVQVVQMRPERGRLAPGECVLCVLTFSSSHYPSDYQLDLICQVFQEAAVTQYQRELHSWEEERERQQKEFLFTDKPTNVIILTEKPLTPPLKTDSPMRKYQTLPPLTLKERAERRRQHVWQRPEAPQPFLLHLQLTAHTHGMHQYQTRFPHLFRKFLRYQSSLNTHDHVSVDEAQREDVEQILTSMFSDIIDELVQTPPPSSMCSSSAPAENSMRPSGELGNSSTTPCVPRHVMEDILKNTLQNLMMEAVRGEMVLIPLPSPHPLDQVIKGPH